MISVWVLVFYIGGYYGGGPTIIDNIATQEECLRVQRIVANSKLSIGANSRCIEVRKVK